MLSLRTRIPLRVSKTSKSCLLTRTATSRSYTSPTAPRSQPPMAQLVEQSETPFVQPPPTSAPPSPSYAPMPSIASRSLLTLPYMLPPDSTSEGTEAHQAMYPSSGFIDSQSMIGICLRRKEHIPRAYQIFRQLIDDAENGSRPWPDADTFGRVLHGVASLGRDGAPAFVKWRSRAERILDKWESLQPRIRGMPALTEQGVRVYRGWFQGLVSAQAPLDPLMAYLQMRSLTVENLVGGVSADEKEACFEALLNLAQANHMHGLEQEVLDVQQVERDRRERATREVVEELQPVKNLANYRRVEGEGELRFSIANIRKALEPISSPHLPIVRQRELEAASLDAAKEELEFSAKKMAQQNDKNSGPLQREVLQSWMHEWLGQLTTRLEHDLAEMKETVDRQNPDIATEELIKTFEHSRRWKSVNKELLLLYLTVLPPEKLALIAILEVMRNVGGHGTPDGMKAVRGMIAVGKGIETEYHAETIRSVSGVDSPRWVRIIEAVQGPTNHRAINTQWRRIGRELAEGKLPRVEDEWLQVWTPAWTQQVHIDVGSYLISCLIDTARVRRTAKDPATGEEVHESQPAFAHTYEYLRGRKLGVIKVNPVIASRLSSDRVVSIVHPKHLPMLVEPRPWTSAEQGAYLIHRVPIMRMKESPEQLSYLKEAIKGKHAEPVLHALDVLSSTPWTINRKVFDVLLEAWNSGKGIADIPPTEENARYEFPARPEEESDPKAKGDYAVAHKRVVAQQRKDHAERCKTNYTLEVARSFLHDTFFLPHNMDFRGRSYPIPPHLSPVGDDLNRGLLLFGERRALGATGLRWLQIHLANVYGFDKMSFEERARFSQDHEAEIFDSADNPLDGKRWWLKAEDPWQCLSTCFELAQALRSPDPALFESSLPVHQDGTCNGMQHYAALGGDVRGAKAVNLENGDRPADIYSRVVDIVNRVVEEDKKNGVPSAMLITEPLGRKIVKQTVMTTVYGVTFVGARDQIAKQLTARTNIDNNQLFNVSAYLAKTVLSCIGDLFSGAKDIQDWLVTCAKLLSRSIPHSRILRATESYNTTKYKTRNGVPTVPKERARLPKELMTPVIWTTPLGLPVVQPYRKPARKQIVTSLQTVYVADPHQPSEVSPTKQATAFPPNFVHSLDATHMFLTALRCKQNGITFAAVHDSYWTHASTVEPMSDLIRDSFIHLHSQDIIGELRKEFIERSGENMILVTNAKAIRKSAVARKEKEEERRSKVRAALGDEVDADVNIANLIQAEAAVLGESRTPEDLGAVPDAAEPEGLSEGEFEELVKKTRGGLDVPVEKIGAFKFVRLKDVIPPCPPRGQFDVERIRDSAYFFS